MVIDTIYLIPFRSRKLTLDKIEEILRAYLDGKTVRRIEQEYDVCRGTVLRLVDEYIPELKRPRHRPRKVDPGLCYHLALTNMSDELCARIARCSVGYYRQQVAKERKKR